MDSYVIYSLVAAVGAIVKFLNLKEVDNNKTKQLIVNIITSSFSGMIISSICLALSIPHQLTIAAVGISGWLGVELIDYLGKLFKKLIADKINQTNNEQS